jgi:hypothetical protein
MCTDRGLKVWVEYKDHILSLGKAVPNNIIMRNIFSVPSPLDRSLSFALLKSIFLIYRSQDWKGEGNLLNEGRKHLLSALPFPFPLRLLLPLPTLARSSTLDDDSREDADQEAHGLHLCPPPCPCP